MRHGVRRLIAINSGRFIYAELDLAGPVHLVARNNAGKSTLVNALQYLYVDDIRKMAFPKNVEETREHYFGENPSYLIFECSTPTGIQTLLVRGLGNIQAGGFERYVYTGPFKRDDYEEEDRRIREFDSIRKLLADRNLAEVPKVHLWEALTGQIPAKAKNLPSLGILPLRSQQEYNAFREVFVKLLALTDASARDLKRLIIACHAHEVGDARIDVAATYKDMFERAVRSEEEYRFIQEVDAHISQGRGLRDDIAAAQQLLREQTPQLSSQARTAGRLLVRHETVLDDKRQALKKVISDEESKLAELYQQEGSMKGDLARAKTEVSNLQAAHQEWSVYSPAMIKELRSNAESLADEISRLRGYLRQAETLDAKAMRKQVEDLKIRLASDQGLLEKNDKAGAAILLDKGLSRPDLDAAFRMLNPALAHQIVGDTIGIKDEALLLDEIRTIAGQVHGDVFQNDCVRIHLRGLRGPDLDTILSRDQLRKRIAILEQDLTSACERLQTAEDAVQAKQRLEAKVQKHKKILESLARYDRYCVDWEQRPILEKKVADLETTLRTTRDQITERKRIVGTARENEEQVKDERDRIQQAVKDLASRRSELEAEIQALQIDFEPDDVGDIDDSLASKTTDDIPELLKRINQWLNRVRSLRNKQADLAQIQKEIEAASVKTRTHRVYFAEADVTWEELIQQQDALPDREKVLGKGWDDLFTHLRANLKHMLTGMHNVKLAVQKLNKELLSYQVSNLHGVELAVQHGTSYEDIVTLTQEGTLFEDQESIEISKTRLQTMIEAEQIIELLELFEIRIRVRENDGSVNEAKSLDAIGSTGTGMTAKAMIFVQLVRAILGKKDYGLHFYLDETGQLDDDNLRATTEMAVSKGMVPITAEPGIRMEPLAHPEVTVYTLGTHEGRFCIDSYQTYQARRKDVPVAQSEVSVA